MNNNITKIILLILVISLFIPLIYSSPNGDLDGDGYAAAGDLVIMRSLVLGLSSICHDSIGTEVPCISVADLNEDGIINQTDYDILRNIVYPNLTTTDSNNEDYITTNYIGYEIEITATADNQATLHSIKQLDYNVNYTSAFKLYSWLGDTYIADVSFNGYYLYNNDKSYLFGNFSIDNKTDLSEFNIYEIINPYQGLCTLENEIWGCVLTNKEGFNIPSIMIAGFLENDELKSTFYYQFNSILSGNGKISDITNGNDIQGLGNLEGDIFGMIAENILAGYGYDILLTNSSYNGIYAGTCYFANDSINLNVEMQYLNCVAVLKSYIDYDSDGILSDEDCNDNDPSIGKCPELNVATSGPSGGSGGGGGSDSHPVVCNPDIACSAWSSCTPEGKMTRTCQVTNNCNRNDGMVTESICNYNAQETNNEGPQEEIKGFIEKKSEEELNKGKWIYVSILLLILLVLLVIISYYYRYYKENKKR